MRFSTVYEILQKVRIKARRVGLIDVQRFIHRVGYAGMTFLHFLHFLTFLIKSVISATF